MSKVVIFIETPRTGAGQDAAQALAAWGYDTVILVDRPEKLDQFLLDDYAEIGTRIVECDTSSLEAIVAASREIGGADLAGLTSLYEYFVAVAAAAARRLGLPGPDPQAIEKSRSKVRMREVCEAATGLNPEYRLANDVDSAVAAAEEIGFPVVVKPVDLTGSVFVRRCENAQEVAQLAQHILGQPSYLGVAMKGELAIEEYLAGPEYSVEIFAGRAIGVTAKTSGSLPYFVELAHRYPAMLNDRVTRLVVSTAERALTELGLLWGPAHVEIKFADQEQLLPRLVEVNPRLGGDRVPELVRLATGIDLVAHHMAEVVGRERPSADSLAKTGGAAIRFVSMPDKGKLTAIEGIEAARAAANVTEVHIKNQIGDEYRSHGSNRDRVAHVIATGLTSDEALANATRGANALHFEWADIEGEAEYV